jgi:PAS domain S-box-containing protein
MFYFISIAAVFAIVLIVKVLLRTYSIQRELLALEYRYKEVVENASDMILLLNKDGDIIEANSAAARILGLEREDELIGQHFFSLINSDKFDKLSWNKFLNNLSATRYRIDDFLNSNRFVAFVADSPENVILDVVISYTNDQKLNIWSVFARDITKQHNLMKEKEQLMQQLNHQQRLESIGTLAGGVAHDFNNYLHAVQGHLELIKFTCKAEDDNVYRHIDKSLEIIFNASNLTKQLLGFARKGKYSESIIVLNDLLKSTVDLFLPNNYDNLTFKFTPGDRVADVNADYVQLQQVILSTLINSVQALESKKSEELTLEMSSHTLDELEVTLNPPSDIKVSLPMYVIKVSDNGVGMDEETIEHIFEPFFTTKRFGEGTGMGMAMSYGIILNHNGWIQVDSKLGEGTSIYIFLPAHTEKDV